MLKLDDIRASYPEELQGFPRFMLREYLQHKILEIVYESSYGEKLCFLGGTCLRIVHGNRRFSEDLDFDNIGLEEGDFEVVAGTIEKALVREGYRTEMRTVMKGAWHCHIKFPGLLYEEGLSGFREEKIRIQLDTEPQHFDFEPERVILNRFEVFTTLLTTPLSLLMAQKLFAVVNRDRKKGRDFYDLVFLMGRKVKPDYKYLDQKLSISTPEGLKTRLMETCEDLDLDEMAKDVEPFLFDARETRKVQAFRDILRQYPF